jgi:predicted Holliday junction resolvase-like endonuclease
MSINRFAKRADKATQTIVDELRALGYSVTYLGLPVDLAVHKAAWGGNAFKFLEVKSARRKRTGDVALDKRQTKQREFCEAHGVPYVTNTIEALQAMGEVA